MRLPTTKTTLKIWAAICGAMLAFAFALVLLTMSLTMATDLWANKTATYYAVHGQCRKARKIAAYAEFTVWRVKDLCSVADPAPAVTYCSAESCAVTKGAATDAP